MILRDIGFGDTDTGDNYPEIAWGPHPIQAEFHPLGGGVCWQLDWSCEFKVSECASRGIVKGTGSKALILFNYETTYSNDEMGFTTRTISGVLQIPQDGSTYSVNDLPLNYRNKLLVGVPNGYKRVNSSWRENLAQNQLHFTIVDQQLQEEPYPIGIAKANVSFTVHASEAGGGYFPSWTFAVSGQLATLPGWPKAWAAVKFFQIVFDRLLVLQRSLDSNANILPTNLSMRHSPFGRNSDFQVSFRIATPASADIFNPNLLYSALPDSNYNDWVTTPYQEKTLGGLWRNAGQTDLRTSAPDQVDLCKPTRHVELRTANNFAYPLHGAFPPRTPAQYLSCPNVTAESSWLAYEPTVQLHRDEQRSTHKRDAFFSTIGVGIAADYALKMKKSGGSTPYTDPGDRVIQKGAPEQLLIFKGKAVRLKYPVTLPKLKSIEGVELDELKNVTESVRGPTAVTGCETFYGRWIQVYRPQKFLKGEVLTMPHPKIELVK